MCVCVSERERDREKNNRQKSGRDHFIDSTRIVNNQSLWCQKLCAVYFVRLLFLLLFFLSLSSPPVVCLFFFLFLCLTLHYSSFHVCGKWFRWRRACWSKSHRNGHPETEVGKRLWAFKILPYFVWRIWEWTEALGWRLLLDCDYRSNGGVLILLSFWLVPLCFHCVIRILDYSFEILAHLCFSFLICLPLHSLPPFLSIRNLFCFSRPGFYAILDGFGRLHENALLANPVLLEWSLYGWFDFNLFYFLLPTFCYALTAALSIIFSWIISRCRWFFFRYSRTILLRYFDCFMAILCDWVGGFFQTVLIGIFFLRDSARSFRINWNSTTLLKWSPRAKRLCYCCYICCRIGKMFCREYLRL